MFAYLKEAPSREQKARDYFKLAKLDYDYYAQKIASGLSPKDLGNMQKAFEPFNNYQNYRQYSITELQARQTS